VTPFFARARRVLNRHGLRGTVRLVAKKLRPRASEQVWYRLPLDDDERFHRPLDESFVLRRGDETDVDLVAQLPRDAAVAALTAEDVRSRLDKGAELWLVTEGDRTAFACWIYRGHAPVPGAKNDGADLPADVVLLEDSIASPDFRGRSVAPRAWSEIGAALRAEGISAMATKVGADNASSRRGGEKAGFREVVVMRNEASPFRSKVQVELSDPDPQTRWLMDLEQDVSRAGRFTRVRSV